MDESSVANGQPAAASVRLRLARSFGAKAYGELSPFLEPGQVPLLMAGLALLAGVILLFVSLERHQKRLDRLRVPAPTEDVLADVPARF